MGNFYSHSTNQWKIHLYYIYLYRYKSLTVMLSFKKGDDFCFKLNFTPAMFCFYFFIIIINKSYFESYELFYNSFQLKLMNINLKVTSDHNSHLFLFIFIFLYSCFSHILYLINYNFCCCCCCYCVDIPLKSFVCT